MYHHIQKFPKEPWITGLLEPKVMARPEAISEILAGDHDVDIDIDAGADRRKFVAPDVLIAHLPFRTTEQFTRKAQVDEKIMARLKEELGDEHLVKLAAAVGQANWTNRFNNAFGVELP